MNINTRNLLTRIANELRGTRLSAQEATDLHQLIDICSAGQKQITYGYDFNNIYESDIIKFNNPTKNKGFL